MHTKKYTPLQYVCYFCKAKIKASSKTEISYRNNWIDGCSDCFILSTMKETAAEFQQKEY